MNRLLALIAVSLLAAAPLHAQERDGIKIRIGGDMDGRAVPRMELADARHALISSSGAVTLLLTDDQLLVQLTDRGIDRMNREIDADLRREEGFFAHLVGETVRGTLNAVFRRAMALPLDEIRDVRYENGRLEVIGHNGDLLFDGMEVDEEEVMHTFRARDARAFVAEFRRIKR